MTLPHGFVIELDRHTRVLDDGRALVGGFPTRLVRLTPRARRLFDGTTLRVRDAASALLADRLLELGMANPVVERLPELPDPRYTVVVPVRDRPRQLDRLLAAIGTEVPVIVVDDGSRDPEAVAAVVAKHRTRLVSLPVNVGPAGARNAGWRLVTTPYIVFADSDTVLAPGTVSTLLRHFADPRVAMAVPRITALPASGAGWIARYENGRSALDLGAHPAAVRPGTPVSWASTACAVMRVDALEGGFDDRMRVGEDVDLCWRLVEEGKRVRYEPAATVAHAHRTRLDDWFLRKLVYGTGAQPLAERHPAFIAPAVFAPWSLAFVALLLAQRQWSITAAGAVLAGAGLQIARKVDGTRHPHRLALRLTAGGAVNAVAQTSALLTRHWWPLTVAGCLMSRRVRRATAVAALTGLALEYRRDQVLLDPVRYGVARRLDDLAYGTGVWLSALRGRSSVALRPRISR
ncbi:MULTISPECIES: mycofactocin biosynthesis glycosyltransferase MftF [Streptomyces]|uniref:Mycofactocin system glycosyltransferase n=1 Tax=Streptomyces prasinus TaxID=67345 RepID=A0ABX6AUL2_9ACTN|nr:mycofactocin biosynthesis glycosyltransferase MftF [Streptomyces prasinus]QEV06139.1 mycofactocin system glycosyltransferase [Streptomyces prasinus]